MALRRMTKDEKRIEKAVAHAFRKHGSGFQFTIFDLAKINNTGNAAAKAGQDIDAAIIAAVEQHRIK
jgi:hypothetical protein